MILSGATLAQLSREVCWTWLMVARNTKHIEFRVLATSAASRLAKHGHAAYRSAARVTTKGPPPFDRDRAGVKLEFLLHCSSDPAL